MDSGDAAGIQLNTLELHLEPKRIFEGHALALQKEIEIVDILFLNPENSLIRQF